QLGSGGPDYVYRVEVVPVQPKLALTIPYWAANSQERQAMAVPRGNRFATLVRATRADFGGEVSLGLKDPPAGVSVSHENVAANMDVVPVVFEAAPDAPLAAKLCDVSGAAVDANLHVKSDFIQTSDLIVYGNQVAFYQARAN